MTLLDVFFTDSLKFIYITLTHSSWPVMIVEIIQRLTHVPAVPGSILGWSSVTCFYSITYSNIPTSVAVYTFVI